MNLRFEIETGFIGYLNPQDRWRWWRWSGGRQLRVRTGDNRGLWLTMCWGDWVDDPYE